MDIRQQRTRKRLRDALLQHLRESPFEDIRVQDLTETADVAIATLYRNYENKLALLDDMIIHLPTYLDTNQFEQLQPIEKLLNPSDALHILPLLQFIQQEKPLIRNLLQTPHQQRLLTAFHKIASHVIRATTPEWSTKEVDVITGCVIGNIYQWVLLDLPHHPEDLARTLHWTTVYGLVVARDEHESLRDRVRIAVSQTSE